MLQSVAMHPVASRLWILLILATLCAPLKHAAAQEEDGQAQQRGVRKPVRLRGVKTVLGRKRPTAPSPNLPTNLPGAAPAEAIPDMETRLPSLSAASAAAPAGKSPSPEEEEPADPPQGGIVIQEAPAAFDLPARGTTPGGAGNTACGNEHHPDEADPEELEGAPPSSQFAAQLAQSACVEAALTLAPSPVKVVHNIPYGGEPKQSLDLYLPNGPGPHPVLMFIHGGGFSQGDKGGHAKKGRAFADAGYLFASINYRLAPAGRHPRQVQDVAKAVRWLRDHAYEYGADGRMLFVAGHSAGAHLAALVATDERWLKVEGMAPSELAGVILLDGAGYDIAMRLKRGNKRTWKMYTDAFGNDPSVWSSASPTAQVQLGEELPPFLLFYAGQMPGPKAHALALARVLSWSGVKVEAMHVPDRNHNTIHQRLGYPSDRTTERVFNFVEQQRMLRAGQASQTGP